MTARSDPPAHDRLIRGALVRAIEVARADLRATDTADGVPAALARIAAFQRLPNSAVARVRAALDVSPAYRARVADQTQDDALDEASWLYLRRPEGWTDQLAELGATGEAAEGERSHGREEEHIPPRRLRAAEDARRRADEARDQAVQGARTLTDELAAERRSGRQLLDRVAALEAERDALLAVLDTVQSALRVADGRRAEADHRVEQSGAAREQLRDERDHLRVERDRLRARLAQVDAMGGRGRAGDAAKPERPARRPAPTPPGMLEDSVEAAIHLIGCPGMVLYVDGYNASIGAWPALPIDDQRDRLVNALSELGARSGVRINVVFDGANPSQRRIAARRGLTVTFTDADREADDVIIEAVATTDAAAVAVASDDGRVRAGARDHGANVLSMGQLFAVLGRERPGAGRG